MRLEVHSNPPRAPKGGLLREIDIDTPDEFKLAQIHEDLQRGPTEYVEALREFAEYPYAVFKTVEVDDRLICEYSGGLCLSLSLTAAFASCPENPYSVSALSLLNALALEVERHWGDFNNKLQRRQAAVLEAAATVLHEVRYLPSEEAIGKLALLTVECQNRNMVST